MALKKTPTKELKQKCVALPLKQKMETCKKLGKGENEKLGFYTFCLK
jgi:hypothetical protein